MEKSREEQAEQRQSTFEMVDTRPINGKTASQPNRAQESLPGLDSEESPRGLAGWISLIAYWIREMLWRRRFWSRLLEQAESREDSSR